MSLIDHLPEDITPLLLKKWITVDDMTQLQIALEVSRRSCTLKALLVKAVKQAKGCDFRSELAPNVTGFLNHVIVLLDGRIACCYRHCDDRRMVRIYDESFIHTSLTIEAPSSIFRLHQNKATGYLLGVSRYWLYLWDCIDGSCVVEYRIGEPKEICDLSDDCHVAVIANENYGVGILNLKTGIQFQLPQGIDGRGNDAMIALSDGRLVIASYCGTCIWDLSTSNPHKTIINTGSSRLHSYSLLQLPDGNLLFSRSRGLRGLLQLWDLTSVTCLFEMRDDQLAISKFVLLPIHEIDHQCRIVSIGYRLAVQTWQYSQSKGLIMVNASTVGSFEQCVRALPLQDGRIAIWTTYATSVGILNPRLNEFVRHLYDEKWRFGGGIELLQLSDGRLLTYQTGSQTISLWKPIFD